MTYSELKSKVDALWLDFHSNGITDPSNVISQISYLMFVRILDMKQSREENQASILGEDYKGVFPSDKGEIRWSHFKHLGGDEMLLVVRDQLFPFLRSDVMTNNPVGHFLKDANCLIPTGSLLVKVVEAIDKFPLGNNDTKGDLYEYLLSKLSTAGIGGQFRTPRHIIRAMVEMVDPEATDTICDPACGTAGFLVSAMEYIKEKYTSPDQIYIDDEGNKHYPGDLLEPHKTHVQNDLVNGFDFDSSMLRIAAMNLLLHGIESPGIRYQDTLGNSFADVHPSLASDHYSVILANPPFKGTFDKDSLATDIKSKVNTSKSELLFLALIVRMLKNGGRGAVIIPDGVLFGASNAHKAVRKLLIEENGLEGVVSLPSGVFKPYAGVSTAILFFTKGSETKDVWFYDVEADGFSLDDKRTPQPDKNDLPDLVKKWKDRASTTENSRTDKCFWVPKKEILDNEYDLSINRYKEVEYDEVEYDSPGVILDRIRGFDSKIEENLKKVEGLLG